MPAPPAIYVMETAWGGSGETGDPFPRPAAALTFKNASLASYSAFLSAEAGTAGENT